MKLYLHNSSRPQKGAERPKGLAHTRSIPELVGRDNIGVFRLLFCAIDLEGSCDQNAAPGTIGKLDKKMRIIKTHADLPKKIGIIIGRIKRC